MKNSDLRRRTYAAIYAEINSERSAAEIAERVINILRPDLIRVRQKKPIIHPLTREQKAARRAESLARIRAIMESK